MNKKKFTALLLSIIFIIGSAFSTGAIVYHYSSGTGDRVLEFYIDSTKAPTATFKHFDFIVKCNAKSFIENSDLENDLDVIIKEAQTPIEQAQLTLEHVESDKYFYKVRFTVDCEEGVNFGFDTPFLTLTLDPVEHNSSLDYYTEGDVLGADGVNYSDKDIVCTDLRIPVGWTTFVDYTFNVENPNFPQEEETHRYPQSYHGTEIITLSDEQLTQFASEKSFSKAVQVGNIQKYPLILAYNDKKLDEPKRDDIGGCEILYYYESDLFIYCDRTFYTGEYYADVKAAIDFGLTNSYKLANSYDNTKYSHILEIVAPGVEVPVVDDTEKPTEAPTEAPTQAPTQAPKPVESKTSIANATVTKINNYTYTGKYITQKLKIVLNGKILKAGTDYTVTYKNNQNPGKATIVINGKGRYTGKITKAFTIYKKANTMTLGKCKKSVNARSTQTMTVYNAVIVKNAKGNVSFKTDNKKVTIDKSGKMTVKKGLAKGKTYKVKVTITAKGDKYHKKKSKTIYIKVKVN